MRRLPPRSQQEIHRDPAGEDEPADRKHKTERSRQRRVLDPLHAHTLALASRAGRERRFIVPSHRVHNLNFFGVIRQRGQNGPASH